MGKRIDYDQALNAAAIQASDTIYAKPNKYGFKINVNHPQIQPLYERYKEHIGEKILSDRQRLNFECLIFQMIERKNKKEVEQCE